MAPSSAARSMGAEVVEAARWAPPLFRVRCVEASGVAYRHSPEVLDIVDNPLLPKVEFGDELLVSEASGDWVRTAHGWVPLTLNGKVRFHVLELDRTHEARADLLERELAAACSDAEAAKSEANALREELTAARLAAMPVPTYRGLDTWTDEERRRSEARDLVPGVANDATLPPRDASPAEQLELRARGFLARHSGAQGLRVRLPVRQSFFARAGEGWLQTMRQCLARLVRLEAKPDDFEVVAIRSLSEEQEQFQRRRTVICAPHHAQKYTADHFAELPSIDSLQDMQWYGELASIVEPAQIVDLALAPGVDMEKFVGLLNHTLVCRSPVGGFGEASESLRALVPRSVQRVFAWPGGVVAQRAPSRTEAQVAWGPSCAMCVGGNRLQASQLGRASPARLAATPSSGRGSALGASSSKITCAAERSFRARSGASPALT